MPRRVLLVLVVTTILGFALRVQGLATQSLWFDEAFSVELASTDLLAVVIRAAGDTHPPLYFLLLSLWMAVAGDGEFAVRFPSVVAATLAIPAA